MTNEELINKISIEFDETTSRIKEIIRELKPIKDKVLKGEYLTNEEKDKREELKFELLEIEKRTLEKIKQHHKQLNKKNNIIDLFTAKSNSLIQRAKRCEYAFEVDNIEEEFSRDRELILLHIN